MGTAEVLISLITEGIIAGVGGILTFLPNIFILFLALAFPGRQRIYGKGRLCDGRHHGQDWAVRKGISPHASGVWVYGARSHGIQGAGEPAGPDENDPDHAVYVLQREASDLCDVLRAVLRGPGDDRGVLHVCNRNALRHPCGASAPYD